MKILLIGLGSIGQRHLRNLKLIEQGWDVKRFWVHEIRDNLNGCINEVLAWKNNNNPTKTNKKKS